MTVIPIVIGALGTILKVIGKLGNKRASRDHQNNRIIKIGQNTKKSAEDLRRFTFHSNSSEKPSTDISVKISQRSNIVYVHKPDSVLEKENFSDF